MINLNDVSINTMCLLELNNDNRISRLYATSVGSSEAFNRIYFSCKHIAKCQYGNHQIKIYLITFTKIG